MAKEASSLDEQRNRDELVDNTCRIGARCVAGISGVLPYGHPVRGVALAELGKLLCVDIGSETAGSTNSTVAGASDSADDMNDDVPLPQGIARLQLAAQVLVQARDELKIGFGKERGGGDVGTMVEKLVHDLEREASVWKKASVASKVL